MLAYNSKLAIEANKITGGETEPDSYSQVRFLANILEQSSQPFCANRPDGKLVVFNEAFCNMLGCERAAIPESKSLEDFVPPEWHETVNRAKEKLRLTGQPQRFGIELQGTDGIRIPVSVVINEIKDNRQNVTHHYCFFNDISEQRRAQKILEESEEKYRAIFNTTNEGWALFELMFDHNGRPCDFCFREVNPGFERQSGLNKNSLIGCTLTQVFPNFDKEWFNIFTRVALDGKSVSFQKYSPDLNKYLEASVSLTTKTHLTVMTIDITKLKQLEDELQEQLHFLQHLIDNIPNPVFYKDRDGVYQGCNQAYADIMGRQRNEIIGQTFFDIAPYEIAYDGWKMDQQLFADGKVQHYDGILPYADGTLHDVIYNKAPVYSMSNKLTGLVGVTVDITERKRAEQALVISEEKFRNIFSQSPIGIAIVTSEGIIVEANRACLDILGVNNLVDLEHFRLFADSILPNEARQKFIKGEILRYQGEFNFDLIRDQQNFDTKKSGCAYLDYLVTPLISHGDGGGYLLQVQDVTEQRKSAQALRDSETQLRRITGTMRDIISQTDLLGTVQYISSSVQTVLGYEPQDMIGKNIWCFTHPDDMHRVREENKHCLTKGCYDKIEFRYRKKDGHYVWLEAVGNPLWDEQGKMAGIVFGTRDITERKHMEREMARLDRLRLAGEMAATIGHEIRNPMTTVHGFLQMLKNEPECSSFQTYFDLMIEELNATNSIITEFLSLAQNKAIYLKVQNLNSIVKNIYPLIAAEAIKSDKQVVMNLSDIPDTGIDSNEIRQLILNLALNGLEAMEPGGTLQIDTFVDSDNRIVLAVKDQGKGIDTRIFDKLGTPFVTTKENGTGLGLAVCYSIADRHNASIDYITGPNGTTFLAKFNPSV